MTLTKQMNKIYNIQSEIKSIIQFSETLYEFKFSAPEGFIYDPGQFVGIRFISSHSRAYSIVDYKDGLITLIVDVAPVKFGGKNSKFFMEARVGEMVNLLGPYGIYRVKETTLPKVFISTGSGIAPFVPMIRKCRMSPPKAGPPGVENAECRVVNFFGVRYEKDDIALNYLRDLIGENFEYVRCVTREEPKDILSKKGRVTMVVPQYDFDWANTEFYICGATAMINDMVEVLKSKGADKIYFEKYG